MTFDAAGTELQGLGDLTGRPAFQMAQREHFALASRQTVERLPDALPGLAADRRLLGREPASGVVVVFVHVVLSPPAPPTRAAPVAAGVERDGGQPWTPADRRVGADQGAMQLEKHFLTHFLCLVGVAEQQAA